MIAWQAKRRGRFAHWWDVHAGVEAYTRLMVSSPAPHGATSPRLLAIDTATNTLAVAVVHGERVVSAVEDGGARASARLLPLALSLLEQVGLGVQELDAVAFGQGPGAFTGLRAAAAAAQGLALGANLPVLALDSLALVAEGSWPDAAAGSTVWVAMDARMDEMYAARYRRTAGGWQASEAPALWPWQTFAQELTRHPHVDAVTGTAWSVFADRLPMPVAAHRFLQHQDQDRGGALARCAVQAWQRGDARLDAAQALPLYVRDKVAQTTDERAAVRQQQLTQA
jgi:tRNA threonylcarbamoyladenosine biosynthesis protein TsaB